MKDKVRIYLAGGMHTDWQDRVVEFMKQHNANVEFIDPRFNGTKETREFVSIDLFGVKSCDIVFAYLEYANPGGWAMIHELAYGQGLGKTTIFVNEKEDRYLSFTEQAVDYSTSSFTSGLLFLWKMINVFTKLK